MNSIDQLREAIQSNDWATALAASDALAAMGGTEALDVLIPLLSSRSRWTRNAAALAVREIGDSRAVVPLVQAIRQLDPSDDRGTLVSALQTMDCSAYFLFLFELPLTDMFEVQNHALDILYDQEFWYSLDDLAVAQAQLETYAQRHDRPPGTDVLIHDLQGLLDDLKDHGQ